jgi:SOS response regulatory protein OraA/RecX
MKPEDAAFEQDKSKTGSASEQSRKKEKAALTWVQDYLSRRSHSESELLTKLLKKDFSREESLKAIKYAQERNWMESPQELAEKVYREWDLKNKSHNWITAYLSEKGLPEVRRCSQREVEKATYHLSKKFGKITTDNYQRAASNISSKGFLYDDFNQALDELKEKNEEF